MIGFIVYGLLGILYLNQPVLIRLVPVEIKVDNGTRKKVLKLLHRGTGTTGSVFNLKNVIFSFPRDQLFNEEEIIVHSGSISSIAEEVSFSYNDIDLV